MGAYWSETILRVGAYCKEGLLNLQVLGPAKHNIL